MINVPELPNELVKMLLLYHFQEAPVPNDPPFTESVTGSCGQTWFKVDAMEVGAVLWTLTIIVPIALTVPHPPVNGMM